MLAWWRSFKTVGIEETVAADSHTVTVWDSQKEAALQYAVAIFHWLLIPFQSPLRFPCLSPYFASGWGGRGAPENARSFRSNLFFNRTPYQIIAHFRFVLSGHINPSLAFGYNLLREVNRRSLPFSSHIYTPLTVRWSYLTIVYNRMIWRKFYWNSLNSRAVCQFSRFVPLRSPTFAQVWGGFKQFSLSVRLWCRSVPSFSCLLDSKE